MDKLERCTECGSGANAVSPVFRARIDFSDSLQA